MANRFELTERGMRRLQRSQANVLDRNKELRRGEVIELTVLNEVSNQGSIEAFFDGSINLESGMQVDLHRTLLHLIRTGYVERV